MRPFIIVKVHIVDGELKSEMVTGADTEVDAATAAGMLQEDERRQGVVYVVVPRG